MFAVFALPRKLARAVGALCLVGALAACDPAAVGLPDMPRGGGSVDTARAVPVALLLPRSAEDASGVARDLENAARLAVSDLGEVAVDLRVYDTAGTEAGAAAAAQRAADAGAGIILGPLFAEAANAAAVEVADDGVNVLSFSNNTTIAGGNLFVLGRTFETTADRLAAYAAREGRRAVVIVHPDNVEGRLGRTAIQTAAARHGIGVAEVVAFPFTEDGAVEAAGRVVTAVEESGADSVFLTSTSAGALPLLAQLLPERGLDPAETQYIGLARWDVPAQTRNLPGLQGGWFAMPATGTTSAFAARYAETYGNPPHPLAGLAYDGIAAIGALAAQRGGDALTRRALTQPAGFQGTGGAFRLRPDGTSERALAVATIRDGEVTILDPAPRRFPGAGF
jgi:hypothetical protein